MIKVKNLVKRFGHINAINNISFTLKKGEILGLLGPNGAGKSTTMKIITGYLPATLGAINFNNTDVIKYPEKIKQFIGYLPETTPVYKDMTVKGFLNFAATIRNLPDRKKAIERVIELCNLQKVVYRPIEALSKGYTQRVCFAQALIHDPPCLILDEPTDGLDPIQKKEVQELIKEMGKSKSILISTHMLDEVEEYCNRIIIISEGKIKAEGSIEEIIKMSSGSNRLQFAIPNAFRQNINDFVNKELSGRFNSFSTKEYQNYTNCSLYLNPGESGLQVIKVLFSYLEKEKVHLSDLKFEKKSLNDAFRTLAVNSNINKEKN